MWDKYFSPTMFSINIFTDTNIVLANQVSRGELSSVAVFTTPDNSISGSAVCSFALADIRDSGDGPSRSSRCHLQPGIIDIEIERMSYID